MRKFVVHVSCHCALRCSPRQAIAQARTGVLLRAAPLAYGETVNLETAKKAAAARPTNPGRTTGACASRSRRPSGDLVYFERLDLCQFASIAISQHKARAAAIFRRPTKVFEDRVAQGRAGVAALTLDGMIASEGGIPIIVGGKIVGAIGLQRRHRPAGWHGLPGRRQRDEIDLDELFAAALPGRNPGRFFSAAHQLGEPFDRRRGDVAERQQHRGPDERRAEIGDLETPVRHRKHACDQRHRGAQRPREAADEDRERPPLPDEGFARRNDGRDAATAATCDRRDFPA